MIPNYDNVSTSQVENYLSKAGWINHHGTWKMEWGDEGHYLNIPAPNSARYPEMMAHALQVIAENEKRDAEKVLADIRVN